MLAAVGVGAAAVLFPPSLPGQYLRVLVGSGVILGLLWPAWLVWRMVTPRPISALRTAGLVVLSLVYLALLTVSWEEDGGLAGQAMVRLLDEGFGQVGAVVVLLSLGLVAVLVVLGRQRARQLADLVAALVWRLTAPRHVPAIRQPVVSAPVAPRRHFEPAPAARREPAPPTQPAATPPSADQDIVIRGPRDGAGAPGEAAAATEPRHDPPERARSVWRLPDLVILERTADLGTFSPSDLKARARIIEETLASFNVQARVAEVQQGPAITQFGLDPAPGVAVSRIVTRQNDLALRLGAPSLRVLAPVPGRRLVGLEVPNASVATVKLGDLVHASSFSRGRLPIGIGMDVAGKPVTGDLARMPHLLVAGATGSGKSVCINSLIASLLVARTPDQVELILIDPKQVEMSQYRGLPHLRLPVVTDMEKVVATLRWAVLEMEKRYTRFSEVGARNIVAFNERFPEDKLSYLVVVIDELADMMMTAADDVERLICRLAQLGRAAGVHLVVATQRPSVDVLTGLIKANLPTRIAFAVSSQTDSRVILDHSGAERLLGRGDALYQPGDEMNPKRVQGAFVSDEEIEALCQHWRAQGTARHSAADEAQLESLAKQEDPEEKLLDEARALLDEQGGTISVSFLQRRLKVGYQKASRIHQTLLVDETAAHAVSPLED